VDVTATEIPHFFSRSTKPLETEYFDIVLSDDNIVSNQVVKFLISFFIHVYIHFKLTVPY
jgi:hypothetical protein